MTNQQPSGDLPASTEPVSQPAQPQPHEGDTVELPGAAAQQSTNALSQSSAQSQRLNLPPGRPLGEIRPQVEVLLKDRSTGVVGFSDNLEPRFRNGKPTGEFESVIFVRTRRHAPLPQTIGGHPVRVIVSGQPRKLHAAAASAAGITPLMGGDSIGMISSDGTQMSAGTIGCFVQDGTGNWYALTCAHIFGDSPTLGQPVFSPVPPDDPTNPTQVGSLYAAILNDTIDAALISLTVPAVASIRDQSLSDGSIAPSQPTLVAKYGGVSHRTEGQLAFVSTTQEFNDDGTPSQMSGLIAVQVLKGLFGLEGDSGSAVVDICDQTDQITGIIIGNAYDNPHNGSFTFVCDINQIIPAFNVQLVAAGTRLQPGQPVT